VAGVSGGVLRVSGETEGSESRDLIGLHLQPAGQAFQRFLLNPLNLPLFDACDGLGGDFGGEVLPAEPPLLAQPPQCRPEALFAQLPPPADASAVIEIELVKQGIGRGFILAQPDRLAIVGHGKATEVWSGSVAGSFERREGNSQRFEGASPQGDRLARWIDASADEEIFAVLGCERLQQFFRGQEVCARIAELLTVVD
jgi:hypothetical protein